MRYKKVVEKKHKSCNLPSKVEEDQKQLWNELFSKYTSESSFNESNILDTAKTDQGSKISTKQLNIGKQPPNSQKPEYSENVMTKKDVLNVVREFIDTDLKSKLRYYFIKGISSRIKRDGKESHWKSLVKTELKNIRRKLNIVYIQFYLNNIIPPCPSAELCNLIEKKHESKLKYYLELRNPESKIEGIYNALIKQEWKTLRKHVSEKYICLYYSILFGPIGLVD